MAKNANAKTWTLDVLADGYRHSNPNAIDTTPPTALTGLAEDVGARTPNSVRMVWNASTDAASPPVTYDVEVNGVFLQNTSDLFYVVTGLAPSTTVSVRVRPRDNAGNVANYSTAVNATSASGASAGFSWPIQASGGKVLAVPGLNIYGGESYGGSGRNPASTGVDILVVNSLANTETVTSVPAWGANTYEATLKGAIRYNAGTRSKQIILAISGSPDYNEGVAFAGNNWSFWGQFAPSPGLWTYRVRLNCPGDHWQLWHMPCYLGELYQDSYIPANQSRGDALRCLSGNAPPGHPPQYGVLVNCEMSRSTDELLDAFNGALDIGLAYCILLEPVGYDSISGANAGRHRTMYGPEIGGAGGCQCERISIERTIFAKSVHRNPLLSSRLSSITNCLWYDIGNLPNNTGEITDPTSIYFVNQSEFTNPVYLNWIRCMFIRGPDSLTSIPGMRIDVDAAHPEFPVGSRYYLDGNVQRGWSNPASQAGFIQVNESANLLSSDIVLTDALPSGRLTNLEDTLRIAQNPQVPTADEVQAFVTLMRNTCGVMPFLRTLSYGRAELMFNHIQNRLNGVTGEGVQLVKTTVEAGGVWTVPQTIIDPLNPNGHWKVALPTAASRHDVLGAGTFDDGQSCVGYTGMEVFAYNQHLLRVNGP